MSQKILFAHQDKLPHLPVPSLQETTELYLKTLEPLTSKTEFEESVKNVSDFIKPGGFGEVLQQRLLKRAEEMNLKGRSWLIDWWNDYAYMGYRDPVVIFVSYFFGFKDDKLRMNPSLRAASIVKGALEFKKLIVSETLEPDTTKAGPLCSEQYRFLFNSTRIPVIPSDGTKGGDASNNDIVVIRKNKFFVIDGRKELSTSQLKRQFDKIYQMAGTDKDIPVGVLTSENRDNWAKTRELLLEDRFNRESLDIIEKAAFVVCLDDSSPVTRHDFSRHLWHGDGRNRFFDKSIQFIVFDNGRAGFLGEHSMMDATPTSRMCEFILESIDKNAFDLAANDSLPDGLTPSKLIFELKPPVLEAISKAEKAFDDLIKTQDLKSVYCPQYGKNLIKKFGVSPDAYAQMVIQLAYYKLYGKSSATYESAQTKKYHWGRTETCRSVSNESVSWVKAMEDPHVSIKDKGMLGRRAVAAQSGYMAKAVNAHGVDRHLLGMINIINHKGLRLSIKPNEAKPSIFTDPSFARSCHWNISTSQITSEYYDTWGWGEVVPDGYGIAYMIKDNCLHFNLTSLFLKNDVMEAHIHSAVEEMRVVFEATIPPKAKL